MNNLIPMKSTASASVYEFLYVDQSDLFESFHCRFLFSTQFVFEMKTQIPEQIRVCRIFSLGCIVLMRLSD